MMIASYKVFFYNVILLKYLKMEMGDFENPLWACVVLDWIQVGVQRFVHLYSLVFLIKVNFLE